MKKLTDMEIELTDEIILGANNLSLSEKQLVRKCLLLENQLSILKHFSDSGQKETNKLKNRLDDYIKDAEAQYNKGGGGRQQISMYQTIRELKVVRDGETS